MSGLAIARTRNTAPATLIAGSISVDIALEADFVPVLDRALAERREAMLLALHAALEDGSQPVLYARKVE